MVNKNMSDHDTLIMTLTEIYNQLEELDSVLEASFSDLRSSLKHEELNKLNKPKLKLIKLEKECAKQSSQSIKRLQLELGF